MSLQVERPFIADLRSEAMDTSKMFAMGLGCPVFGQDHKMPSNDRVSPPDALNRPAVANPGPLSENSTGTEDALKFGDCDGNRHEMRLEASSHKNVPESCVTFARIRAMITAEKGSVRRAEVQRTILTCRRHVHQCFRYFQDRHWPIQLSHGRPDGGCITLS